MKKVIFNIFFGVAIAAPMLSVAQTVSTSTGDVGTTTGGTVKVQDSNGDLDLYGDSGGNFYLRSNSGEFRFRPNGTSSNHFTLSNTEAYFRENVSIGSTNANLSEQLYVHGSALFRPRNLDGANLSYMANSRYMLMGWNRSRSRGEFNFISNRELGSAGGFSFSDLDNAGQETLLMFMKGNGNIGIGHNNPTQLLHLKTTANDVIQLESTGTAATLSMKFKNADYEWAMRQNGGDQNQFQIRDVNKGQNRLSIDTDGNVGIGISSPDEKLHVENGKLLVSNSSTVNTVSEIRKTIDDAVQFDITHGAGLSNEQKYTLGTNSNREFIIRNLTFNVGSAGDILRVDESNNNVALVPTNGAVGIGTTSLSTHKLAVEGTIGSREVKVEMTAWEDRVFKENYDLNTLEEVESFISENQHLPNIPSEEEVLENGIYLGDMNAKLLRKIEELTLYMIELNKQVQSQQDEISELKELNSKLIEQLKN